MPPGGCTIVNNEEGDNHNDTNPQSSQNEAPQQQQADTHIIGGLVDQGTSLFVQALANLPSLETLHLDGLRCLSQDAMTAICQSSNLKSMELWNMTEDLNHYGPVMARAWAKPAHTPTTKAATTTNQNCDDDCSGIKLQPTTSALRELEISTNLQCTAGQAIIEMLQTNTSLEKIGLDIDYNDQFGDALASVLSPGHNSTLKRLHLRLVGQDDVQEEEEEEEATEAEQEEAIEVANTRQGNWGGRILLDENGNGDDDGNNNNHIDDDDGIGEVDSSRRDNNRSATEKDQVSKCLSNAQTFIKAMEKNTSLEHVHMNFYHISRGKVHDALLESVSSLLETNFVLQHLSLRGEHNFVDLGETIDFRLRLNQAGRYRLLLGDEQGRTAGDGVVAPKIEWVQMILSHQQDLSIVFYLLSMNPSLCSAD